MSTYLPPVLITFTADARDFFDKVGQVKATLADLDKSTTEAKIGGDSKPFETVLSAVKSQLAKFGAHLTNTRLGADIKPAQVGLATVKTELAAVAKTGAEVKIAANAKPFEATYATVLSQLLALTKSAHNVDLGADTGKFYVKAAELLVAANKMEADVKLGAKVDWAELVTKIAAMKALVAAADLTTTIKVGLGGAAVAGAAGAGGLATTLLALLGLGGGKGTNFAGLPASGSLLALGGLGLEHLITTLISVVGSAAGAIVGAGALMATSASIIAVGMGSDLAVAASTIADTKALATAITKYGANSAQVKLLEKQLGSTPGVTAEVGLANAGIALDAYWDQATSDARVAAVNLYQKFLTVAQTYIPKIAAAATTNFTAINKAIQPLIDWLNSPTGGLKIFDTLESAFAKNIPKSTTTLTNAVEGILKIFSTLTPQTGGFLNTLSKFFAQLNTIAGQKTADIHIQSFIGDFHTWVNFLKTMVSTIYNVFSASKKPGTMGVGETIIQTLTGWLTAIDNFAKSVSGKAQLGTLLEVHKNEALAILSMIPPIAKALATVYGAIAPGLVRAITDFILGVVTAITDIAKLHIGKFELGDWAVGLGLIALKLTGLGKAVAGLAGNWLKNVFGLATKAAFVNAVFTGATFAGTLGGTGVVGGASTTEATAAGSTLGKIAGPLIAAAVVVAIAEGSKKYFNPANPITKIAGLTPTGTAFANMWYPGGAAALLKAVDATGGTKSPLVAQFNAAFAAFQKSLKPLQSVLSNFLTLSQKKQQTSAVQEGERTDLSSIAASLKGKSAAQVAAILAGLTPKQESELKSIMSQLGMSLVDGVETGITKRAPSGKAAMEKFCLAMIAAAKNATGSKSPSTVFAGIGRDLVLGLSQGVTADRATATGSMTNMTNAMLATLTASLPQFRALGAQMTAAVAAGAASSAALPRTTGAVTAAVAGAGVTGGIGTYNPTYHVTITAPNSSPKAIASSVNQVLVMHNQDLIRRLKAGSSS